MLNPEGLSFTTDWFVTKCWARWALARLPDAANFELCSATDASDRGLEYVEAPGLARAS